MRLGRRAENGAHLLGQFDIFADRGIVSGEPVQSLDRLRGDGGTASEGAHDKEGSHGLISRRMDCLTVVGKRTGRAFSSSPAGAWGCHGQANSCWTGWPLSTRP